MLFRVKIIESTRKVAGLRRAFFVCRNFCFCGQSPLKLSEITVRGVPVGEHLQKFAEIVKQLNDAQEKQEYLLIADTIEYEIMPIVPVWKEIFEAVSHKIG